MTMGRIWALTTTAVAFSSVLAGACTLSSEGANASSASSSGAGGSKPDTGGASSTSAATAGGGATGSGGTAASNVVGSGGVGGAASSSSAEASATASSSTGPGEGAIVPCGAAICDPGQVCCFDSVSKQQLGCAGPGGCNGAAELACDGPADCGGAICCGSWVGATWTEMSCKATCDGVSDRIMCGGDGSMCSVSACTESGAANGYYWCT